MLVDATVTVFQLAERRLPDFSITHKKDKLARFQLHINRQSLCGKRRRLLLSNGMSIKGESFIF